ncbi:MAG TPA: hypothetical protein PKV72_06690 [Candidatus Peribacteria bacterium]|nr:hypothetical protein [Candidatus Peribacteria bacterium]
MRKLVGSVVFLSMLLPSTALALEGIGPRVSVVGTVEKVTITDKQKFAEEGGEFVIRANNGQAVNVVLGTEADYEIISEGKLSRRSLLPSDVQVGMQVRIRGWRVNSNTLNASLFIITNIELNPLLSASGQLQSITDGSITVLAGNGESKTYQVDSSTQVQVNYELTGMEGLSLVGKQVLLTLNPLNTTQVRIIRVTGKVAATNTTKPSTVELKRR